MKEPRVIEIIECYKKNNLVGVYAYLTQDDMIIDEKSWAAQIKKLIENNSYHTAKDMIELVAYKFTNLKLK